MTCRGLVYSLALAGAAVAILPRADAAQSLDVAKIHVEAIGGRQRVDALRALRASGTVITGGQRVRFLLVAARPDRVRIETDSNGRTLVQGTDGVAPPWEFDTGSSPVRSREMAEAPGKTFQTDAEFDDPLIAGAERGYTFDFVGKSEVGGRSLLRVMVTRKLTDTFALYLDADTYLIVLRVEQRTSAGGRQVQVVTRYDDFRPVEGVLLPHEVTLSIDGKFTQQTKIEVIDGNPRITDGTFSRPKEAAAK
jgi:hypothetical protein